MNTLAQAVNPEDEVRVSKKDFAVSLLNQIKSGVPLMKIQLPMALIEPRSLIEYFSDRFAHLDILMNALEMQSAEARFLENLKFYMSGWHLMVKDVRHPFNPILGEVFKCDFKTEGSDSETHFIAEQTSHHPPESAFCLYNKEKRFSINASAKPHFSVNLARNRVEVKLEGSMHSHSSAMNEDYFATLPSLLIKGIVLGSLSIDLLGKVKYHCPGSKLVADIDFQTQTMFGYGSNNYVTANIYHEDDSSEILYTLQGHWNDTIFITDCSTEETTVFFDARATTKLAEKVVAPVSQQQDNESQRVWKGVRDNIKDEIVSQREKSIVENRQRALAKERLASGKPHVIKHFIKNKRGEYAFQEQSEVMRLAAGGASM